MEGSSAGLAEQLPTLLDKARSADEALAHVALTFLTVVPSLSRASLRKLLPDKQQVEIVAVWSKYKTELTPGLRMSVLATSFVEVMSRGGSLISREMPGSNILDDLLALESVKSWASIPLFRNQDVAGLLSLSSRDATAFDQVQPYALDMCGSLVERRLLDLMRGASRA